MATDEEKEKLMHDFRGRISSLTNVIDLISSSLEKEEGDPRFIELVDKAVDDLSSVWKKIKKEIE